MAVILRRAAELQATADDPTHSLESIQQIGQQVGIDPVLIAHAAATLTTPDRDRSVIWGDSAAYRLSRRLPAPLRPADHAEIAAIIRDHLPVTGEVRPVGEGFEWHGGPADNKTLITVVPV